MTVGEYTLGCRLNQTESEAMIDSFLSYGFSLSSPLSADIVIVNTCTVTSKAEQKARREIRKIAENAKVILVTGCYAEVNEKEVLSLSDKIIIFTLDEKSSILDIPKYIVENSVGEDELFSFISTFPKKGGDRFRFDSNTFSFHSRAFLKIQDGCDNSCAYCRTSIARGKGVSLDEDEVVRRAKALEEKGFHEIVLTGVNLASYNDRGTNIGKLCSKLLSSLSDDIRIRFSSLEAEYVDETFLSLVSDERIFPHFHLPLQSASERLLAYVDRKYSMDHLKMVIERMRKEKDDPFIAVDLIAGLPSESEKDFDITLSFLREYDISSFHVFPYSPREGTKLFSDKNRLPERIRDERALILRKLGEENYRRYVERNIGKTLEAIIEEKKKDALSATTGNYLKVRIEGSGNFNRGALVRGKLSINAGSLSLLV